MELMMADLSIAQCRGLPGCSQGKARQGLGLCICVDGEVHNRSLILSLIADLLCIRQKEYFDEAVADESPKQTKARLAKLAHEAVGLDESKFLELVSTAKGNSGSGVTNDLKLQVKLGR